jgi:hypothetical protein
MTTTLEKQRQTDKISAESYRDFSLLASFPAGDGPGCSSSLRSMLRFIHY